MSPATRTNRARASAARACGLWLSRLAMGMLLLIPASVSRAENVSLGTGDKLRVQVEEWPPLSGEYTVGAGNTLQLPIVGAINTQQKSEQDLAAEIAQALQERKGLPALPNVSVIVTAYRPFFVYGDVQHPNEYPYRPGLTVQEAISIAGGFFRSADGGAVRFERDAIVARGDLNTAIAQMNRLRVREARLRAERDGQSDFQPPAQELSQQKDPDLQAFIANEKKTLQSSDSEFQAKQKIYQDLLVLYAKEIESLNLQIDSEDRQLKAINAEMSALANLKEKGLALSPRQWTVERTLAQITGTKQALGTEIIRTQQNITLAKEKIEKAAADRRIETDAALLKVAGDIADARTKIETERQLVAEAEQFGPAALMDRVQRRGWTVRIEISRKQADGKPATVTGGLTDEVLPGDVLTIDRQPGPATLQ